MDFKKLVKEESKLAKDLTWVYQGKDFSVVVSGSGIIFNGTFSLNTIAEYKEFAIFMVKVWNEHMKLAPKLTKTVSGH